MIINERVKRNLLTWNDDEPIYKQFEKKCEKLSDLTGLVIDPLDYQVQYKLHESRKSEYIDLQTKLYAKLYKKYPNVEFGMSGRLKSPFSHYEKVIRKFVQQFEKDEIKPVSILDVYAIKVFLRHINYPVDKISVDSEGIYIDSGANEFRFSDGDSFDFEYNEKTHNVVVQAGASNIWIDNSIPHISTTIDDEPVDFLLNTAKTYKRSTEQHLIKYCYEFQKEIEKFFNTLKSKDKQDNSFVTKKKKDYIETRKESGYASLQMSFYNEKKNLGIECQTRTHDMEKFNNEEREYGYKPNEHKLSRNSISQISRFALTTRFKNGGFQTYDMSDPECFELIFGTTIEEYSKKMKPTLTSKEGTTIEDDGAR